MTTRWSILLVVAQFQFLRVLPVSLVNAFAKHIHHGGTEDTEIS